MSIIQLLRILYRNWILLLIVPFLMAFFTYYFTKNEVKKYTSSTIIYTGIASGYNIDSKEGKIDYFATNNAFDNLINIIKSKETLEEVSLCLLTQHLMLDKATPTIISKESYNELKRILPKDIKFLIDKSSFQKTYDNLKLFKNKDERNFIYKLINLTNKHYSISAISKLTVKRIQSSDLIEITYSNDDPGICLQTLVYITKNFTENYKELKSDQTDDVVKYFEEQIARTSNNLKGSEDELLSFNKDNKIINYYEQTKHIAIKKEDLDVTIQNIRMDYASSLSALKEIEEKLTDKEKIYLKSEDIVKKRNKLALINSRISLNEIYSNENSQNSENINSLKRSSLSLQKELEDDVNQLYLYGHSSEGVPLKDLLSKWLTYTVKKEESKSSLDVLNKRKNEFSNIYSQFAPLGATLKRIERKIGVTENEYLELLHSLTLAKLKQQNAQNISSALKIVDKPSFPLSPESSKRKLIIIASFLLGFILVLFFLILIEYFDNSIKTSERIESFTMLAIYGIFPKLLSKKLSKKIDTEFIYNRSIELLTQNIKLRLNHSNINNGRPYIIIIFSTRLAEGKTFISEKLVNKFREYGENTLYLNYSSINIYNKLSNKFSNNIISEPDNLNYIVDHNFFEISDLTQLLSMNNIKLEKQYKYIFLELPALINYTFPVDLVREADCSLLVCNAKRIWNKADDTLLNLYKEISLEKNAVILNGVEIYEMEKIIGEIPRKRSKFRKLLKIIIGFQFQKKYL